MQTTPVFLTAVWVSVSPVFPLMFSFCSRIQSRAPHGIYFSSALVSDSFWVFLCIFMTLNVEKYWPSIVQNILQPGLLRFFFLMISLNLWVYAKNTTGVTCPSQHTVSRSMWYTHNIVEDIKLHHLIVICQLSPV